MAYTLRTTDEEEKILESLRELTNEAVTTKAIIRGAVMLLELTKEHEATLKRLQESEKNLNKLKKLSSDFLLAKSNFESFIQEQ